MNNQYIVRNLDNVVVEIRNSRTAGDGECLIEDIRYLNPIKDISGIPLYEVQNNKIVERNINMLPEYISYRKNKKNTEIQSAFESNMSDGHFMSIALGIEVDCRRGNIRNDLQNAESLVKKMNKKGIATIDYVGRTTTKTAVTKQMLDDLTYEMIDYANALYEKKWTKESQIKAATTIEQIEAVKWD